MTSPPHDKTALPGGIDGWSTLANAVADEILGPPRSPLAELVAKTSKLYTRQRDALGEAAKLDALQARLRFFFARDLQKVDAALHELAFADALPAAPSWRVLDVGAGLGTTTLGLARFAARHKRQARFTCVDVDPQALRSVKSFARRLDLDVSTFAQDALRFRPEGRFDFITLGLFLNELPFNARVTLTEQLLEHLQDDGTMLIVEPALREVTRELHQLRDALLSQGVTVFAPCLHDDSCPMLQRERDWCHEDRPFRMPEHLAKVAKDAGLRFERLTYAYLSLRRDERRLRDSLPKRAGRMVSQPLVSKGKRELFVCGQREAHGVREKWVRLNRKESAPNASFGDAARGDVLVAEKAVTRGDGLRIEAETHVDRIRVGEAKPEG